MDNVREVAICKITKLFGLNGELVINLYDNFPDDPSLEEPLFVYIDNIAVPLFMKSFRKQGTRKAVIQFDDLESEARVKDIIGKKCFTFDSQEDEDDIVGYTIKIKGSTEKGVITNYIDDDINPLFEVDINGKSILIPDTEDFITDFNEKKREITMSLPEGLIDIND